MPIFRILANQCVSIPGRGAGVGGNVARGGEEKPPRAVQPEDPKN